MDLDILVRGLTNGSLYALIAIGFNILYRPTNVFNFAQGDLVMLGAMIGATVLSVYGYPWLVGLPIVMVVVGMLALLVERVAVAPILRRSSTSHGWVISTLAVSLIISNLVGHIWFPDPIFVAPPSFLSTSSFVVMGARISTYQIALIVLTVLLVIGIEYAYRTRYGKAVNAVAEDRDAALLRGINPDQLSRWSFFLGGAFAAATGLIAAPLVYASTGLGPALLLKGFAATAVGGVGSNRGSLLAGYIIGLVEATSAAVLSPGWQLAATFLVVLLILLVWPRGIFGSAEARTV